MFKQGELQQLLTATNGWRREPAEWGESDPDLKAAAEAPFVYNAGVLTDLKPGGLYVLRGPRRVGKSVEVKRTIVSLLASGVDPQRITHFAVDGWRADELRGLIRATRSWLPESGPRYWFLDEITGVTGGWAEQIKWLRDNDPQFRADTVVLTGSSAADLTDSIGKLAGRRGPVEHPDRTLLPMGFRSFARLVMTGTLPTPDEAPRLTELTHPFIRDAARQLSPWLDQLTSAWETYLRVGGFPRAVSWWIENRSLDPPLIRELTDQLHGRAFRSNDWSRPQTVALLARVSRSLGSPTNISATARHLGASTATTKRRLDDLRNAFVIWPCHRERELRPYLRAQEKLYFTDPLFTRIAADDASNLTQLSEQQIGMVLMRHTERQTPGVFHDADRVLHQRNKREKEIDFVGPDFGGLAIESKYVDSGSRRGLHRPPDSALRRIVATRSELNLDDPDLPAIPAAFLGWMLDS